MEQHSIEQQPSSEPKLCGNNCGFFGNAATMGLCSKCFKETHAEQKKTHEESSPPQPVAAMPAPPASVEQTPVVEAKPAAATPEAEAAHVEVPVAETALEQPEKPAQANRSRCYSCNKKIGLLGFECRCGYVYCSSHRHAAEHTCSFDYASMDRERLSKANPLIAASKLEKF